MKTFDGPSDDWAEFADLYERCGILGYVGIGYGVFHLTGIEGILDEIDDYVALFDKREKEARSETIAPGDMAHRE